MQNNDGPLLIFIIAMMCIGLCLRRRTGGASEFGTAAFATDKLLKAWGMVGKRARGLVLGRSLSGSLIRMPRYTHTLVVGGTGSGKGVGVIIPNLLDYHTGSMIVFDVKGDLFAATAKQRHRRGSRVIRLAPFTGGTDTWNPLDTIELGPMLIDHAKAMAESLIVRLGTEHDQHWNDKAAEILSAILVFVLLRLPDEERNLNSVADIASDRELLAAVGEELWKLGGVPGRLGSVVKALFESGTVVTKEGSGVLSTLGRHLSWLSSELVAESIATSTFDPRELLLGQRVTLYLQIPADMLDAMRGLLRCWVSTLVRVIGSHGSEEKSEVLLLLDEASALGSLAAIEETTVRGRSAGVRMLLVYQSDSQVQTAFRDKPTLLYDNCDTQIYLSATSFETAERLSKMLGSYTQQVNSYGENAGGSRNTTGQPGGSVSYGSSTNTGPSARPLMFPDEIRNCLGGEYLIAFLRDLPAPILARKIRWFADRAFNPKAPRQGRRRWLDIALLTLMVAMIGFILIRAKVYGYGPWQQ